MKIRPTTLLGVVPRFMKTRYILLSLLTLSTAVFASLVAWPPYDYSKPPSLSLPVAYERMMMVLGQATNQYHCIDARVSTDYFRGGEWDFALFTPTPTNGTPRQKWVAVYFDGTVNTNVSEFR